MKNKIVPKMNKDYIFVYLSKKKYLMTYIRRFFIVTKQELKKLIELTEKRILRNYEELHKNLSKIDKKK